MKSSPMSTRLSPCRAGADPRRHESLPYSFGLQGEPIELHFERVERVAYGIGNCGRRRHGTALADALDAEWVERGRRMLVDEMHARDLARSRHDVVRQRAGEELTFGIIIESLHQCAADALRGAADDLPLDQHRIDDDAAIVRDDIFLD